MKEHVMIEYQFIFEPSKTWGHVNEFENFFVKALDSIDLKGVSVPLLNNPSKKIIMIVKKPEETPAPPKKRNNPKVQLKNIRKQIKKK